MSFRSIVPALLFLCSACSEYTGTEDIALSATGIEVHIAAMQEDTRTALENDGRTVRWSEGDRIAVWAADAGSFAFAAQPFTLYSYNGQYTSADFSATVSPMPEGTYTYYAVYPMPATVHGTTVTYTLPAIQDGSYHGAADILLAAPVTGPALDIHPRDELALRFRHLCHAVRIEIPAGRNRFGEPVKRLEVTFPMPVAGTLTFDAAAPDPVPVLSEGTNTITLEFPGAGLTDAEGAYAWAFVAPGQIEGPITFRAYNAQGYQACALSQNVTKTLVPGRVTPFTLTVPEARPVTYLQFKTVENRLGEDLTAIRLTAPEALFAAPFSAKDTTTQTAIRTADGNFRIPVYADTHPTAELGGRTLQIDYESENALLQNHVLTLPATLSGGAGVEVPITVPYLYEEDFSGVTSFHADDDHGSGSHATNPSAVQLDAYGLAGWTGARVGGSAGNAVRVCCHYEGAGVTYGRYDGRIDSAPLDAIKPGHKVNVQVDYNYDGGTTRSDKDTQPVYAYGYTTQQGGMKGNSNIDHQVAGGIVLSKTNDYSSIRQSNTFIIGDCTNQHRLSWKVSNNRSGWTSYFGDYYLYLDNIRVQIVK